MRGESMSTVRFTGIFQIFIVLCIVEFLDGCSEGGGKVKEYDQQDIIAN
jgi:hypothetical protein